jgi:hypothetical protein
MYLGKEPLYQLNRRLGVFHGQSDCFEERNLFSMQGFETWTTQPVQLGPICIIV